MTEAEFDDFKIEAILRSYYFSIFAEMEKSIREVFKENVVKIDQKFKNKLYYYYGATHSHFEHIDYDKNSIVKTEKCYKDDELFNDFSLMKIINIDKRDKLISNFNIEIESINRKTVSYSFHDVIKKLIEMRNILAHEPKNFEFKDKHIVELLSSSSIGSLNDFYFGDLDMANTNNKNQEVLSNLIFMKRVISTFELPLV